MTIHQCKINQYECPEEGCRYCKPQEYIDRLSEQIKEIKGIIEAFKEVAPLQAGAWLLEK